MKKHILTILTVSALAAASITACGAKSAETSAAASSEAASEAASSETASEAASSEAGSEAASSAAAAEATGEYQYVSPADAVKAAAAGDTHVVDVRTWEDYTKGRIADSEFCPIFPLEDESLVDSMTEYTKANLNDGKKIYIVCNSGKRGAEKATGVMIAAGIDPSLIYTVEGGAKALANEKGALTTDRTAEKIDWQYVSGKDAIAADEAGTAQIVDVRDDDTYAKGHLKDSLQVNLKATDDPAAQTAMYDLAAEKLDKTKPVYLLCYSGNKCAKTAISVLKDAGFDTKNLFIIENGAKDADVSAAFVTE